MERPTETTEVQAENSRRAHKRPHSPPKELSTSETSTTPEDVLKSNEKRDKLMRLLGGKKRKNETAASKWLERVRSREDELKVSTDLESQFNESLSNRLSGASRRHLGIGFKDDAVPTPASETSTTTTSSLPGNNPRSVVSGLSQCANIPSLSSRSQRPNNPSHDRHFPQLGHNMNPVYQIQLQNNNMGSSMPPPGYGYRPQMHDYVGYHQSPNLGYGYLPPTLPDLPPPPPPDVKPPEPRSRNAFYAQFKKAS